MKPNCDNCKNRPICRYYPSGEFSINLPTWEIRGELIKFLVHLFPKHCGRFEAIKIHEDRNPDGTLIGHKPLRIWYPNDQRPEREECKCYACSVGHFSECYHKRNKPIDDYGEYRITRFAEKYGYDK
jgi:hypothetical protein